MQVIAPGLVCPVGLDAESACAAFRAGIAIFEELPYRDQTDEPVIGTMVPDLDPGFSRHRRLLELLIRAVKETLGKVPSLRTDSVPLLVGLAESDRPGGGGHLVPHIVGAIQRTTGLEFHPNRSGAVAKGHIAGFHLLRVARRLLEDSSIPACLVCAVDSYVNAASLNWLEKLWRLKTNENSDGVIPGESAAAVLVARAPTEDSITVSGLGFATEAASILSEEPLLGRGMADAVGRALAEAGIGIHDIRFRISDVAGESYGFKEVALAEAIHMRQRPEHMLPLWHCAESIGDMGAAASLCQIIAAHHAFQRGYAPGVTALCHGSAISGDRAAAVLRATRSTNQHARIDGVH